MNYLNIQHRINLLKTRLNQLNYDLDEYRKKLRNAETAKTELEQKKKQYQDIFRGVSSYPNIILAIDSLGLIGVEKIQAGIKTVYGGTKEKNFANSMEGTLQNIQRNINREENNIATCQQRISRTKDDIEALERQLTIG
jgi:predicted  nucleic acid-binding Zn-ribbon protein